MVLSIIIHYSFVKYIHIKLKNYFSIMQDFNNKILLIRDATNSMMLPGIYSYTLMSCKY